MGNDGGSIPTRRELAKTAKQAPNTTELKATQLESQTHKWENCPLSHRPLTTPMVSDGAGILYNKDAVLEYLLPSDDLDASKSQADEIIAGRVKSLRDVVEVKFQTETDSTTKREKKVCPITSRELGPGMKAVYLVPCGHAFSELAIREVGSDICMSCNEPYTAENAVIILPLLREDVLRLEQRMKMLTGVGLTHSLKKAFGSKKRKSKHAETDGKVKDELKVDVRDGSDAQLVEKSKKRSLEHTDPALVKANTSFIPQSRSGTATPLGGIKNAATASLTAKVMLEQEEANKRRKLGMNSNLKSLFSGKESAAPGARGSDFMTRGFSIPKRA